MSELSEKLQRLIRFGRKGATEELQKCVEDWEVDEVVQVISERIQNDEFSQILGFFLNGLTQSGQSHIMRFKVTQAIIQEFEKQEIPLFKANTITSYLKLEVSNFSTNHLVKLCDLCVKSICSQDEEDDLRSSSHVCWKELLPSMLAVLLDRRKVNQHGTSLTGEEYKGQVVKALCQADWNMKIVTSLASMFINIPLSLEEHLQVVNKMCCCLRRMAPQELPPLVHEMLDLCKDHHGLQLLTNLHHYFHSRLYSSNKSRPDHNCSQMIECNNIEGSSIQDTKQALSTVLYHINKVAASYSSIKEFVKTMDKVARGAPEVVLQPTLVSILFSISILYSYEEQIFVILKNAVIRSVTETEMRQESAWMRNVKISKFDLLELIVQLIDCSKNGQLGAEEGLVNLAFELLKVSSVRGKEVVTERVWFLGTSILLRLVRSQRHIANSVLQRLCDNIITGESVQQYTRCLGQMCREMRLVVIEQQSVIIELLSYLKVIPWLIAREVIFAVLPVVLHAPSVRDNLMLVLRKALFARELTTRKMAVYGFIEMLKILRLEQGSLGQLSQGSSSSTFSGYNFLSQVSVEVHSQVPISNFNTKEAICLEVLGALRGCLNKQSEVRSCVYQGLVEVIQSNPALTGAVLFWLRGHFLKQCDLDSSPPLRLNQNFAVQGDEAILQEPIGALVHLVQQVVRAAADRKDEGDEHHLPVFRETLDKLVDGMGQCQLENFDLDEHVRLMDSSIDNRKAADMLRQALGVYEALMCYCINTWTTDTAEQGTKVLSLLKGYSRLVEFAKNSTTGGAGTKKEVEQSTSARTQPEKKGRPGRPLVFKLPPTILGLPFLSRALDLLHLNEVPWSTTHAATGVKGKREFHRFVMTVVVQYVAHLKSELKHGNVSAFKPCAKLAGKLYKLCICRLSEVDAFDRPLATLVLESFIELIQMTLTHCRNKWKVFLQEMSEIPAEEGVIEQLFPVVNQLHSLLTENLNDNEEASDEAIDKKMSQLLASTFALLTLQLPADSNQSSEVLEQVRSLCNELELRNIPLARTLAQLLLSLVVRTKAESQLLVNMAKQMQQEVGVLPDMDAEEVNPTSSLAIINTHTKQVILTMLCTGLKGRLEEVDWITARLDAEYIMLSYPSDVDTLGTTGRELLRSKERETVTHMAKCVQCAVSLSICAPPPGPSADLLFRLYGDVFDTLTRLTKYFIKHSSKDNKIFEQAWFDKVIKLSGKGFAKNMYAFIFHIGETKNEESKKRKRGDALFKKSKVLRETRLIPNLVRRKETFDQCVIKLAKDCKCPHLSDIIKHTSARDFNIKPQTIRKALEDTADNGHNTQAASRNGNDSGSEAEEDDVSSRQGDVDDDDNDVEGSSSDDERPPTKRTRGLD